jgi:hypothetical protein
MIDYSLWSFPHEQPQNANGSDVSAAAVRSGRRGLVFPHTAHLCREGCDAVHRPESAHVLRRQAEIVPAQTAFVPLFKPDAALPHEGHESLEGWL